MAEVIKMPRMSDTMTEGVIQSWLKKTGDQIKTGDVLAEVETDKATMELESYFDGTLLYIGVKDGETVPVDAVLAVIGKPGEDYQSLINQKQPAAAPSTAQQTQTEKKPQAEQQPKPEQQPTVAEASAGKDEQPATDNEQPTTNKEQPPAFAEASADKDQQPPSSAQATAGDATSYQQPITGNQQ